MSEIPNPLPVGISRTVQHNNAYQRERNLPEDRNECFSAHIGIDGVGYAKNFRIGLLGERVAYAYAVAWRKSMEAKAKANKPHGKLNMPGKRRALV